MSDANIWFQYKYNGKRLSTEKVLHEWLLFLHTDVAFFDFYRIMTNEDMEFFTYHFKPQS